MVSNVSVLAFSFVVSNHVRFNIPNHCFENVQSGDTFGCRTQMKKHIQYLAMGESVDNYPIKGSHRDPDVVGSFLEDPPEVTECDIREQLKDKEIMVVVEGIEPMVSGTFQALQSYKIKDIYFGGRFAPCMSQQNGKIFVDIDR